MAFGLPVVAINSGGISTIVQDGLKWLLCDEKCVWQIADNICSLLDDEKLYKKIIENSKKQQMCMTIVVLQRNMTQDKKVNFINLKLQYCNITMKHYKNGY